MGSKTKSDSELLKRIATRLYEVGGIKFGDFILTSGKKSPYYIDLRIVPSHNSLFENFAKLSAEILEEGIEEADKLAGVPTSGLPFATLIAHEIDLPLIYTRSSAKSHGRKKAVEGKLEKNDEVIIIDDITTTGGSIKKAVEIIRKEGGRVANALVMIDREEGAEENLKDIGINLHSCFNISELIKYLKETSFLNKEKYSLILDYLGKNH